MRNLITILTFCLLAKLSFAQTSVVKLWPGTVPGETEAKHPPVEYTANTSGNNIHRISNITDPALIVYKPGKNANGAAVIIAPAAAINIWPLTWKAKKYLPGWPRKVIWRWC